MATPRPILKKIVPLPTSGAALAKFVPPMLLRKATKLPVGHDWLYELKWDGFRCVPVKNGKMVHLWSRNHKDLTGRFPGIVTAIQKLKIRSAVLDGEIVCLDEQGRPCFEDLHDGSSGGTAHLFFYTFDLLHLNGRDLKQIPLVERRDRLRKLMAGAGDPLRVSEFLSGEPDAILKFVKKHRLEGIVAKRADSPYKPGERSAAWSKFKVFQCARFLVGGYHASGRGFDALLVGSLLDGQLRYAAKVQTFFRPKEQAYILDAFRRIQVPDAPFLFVPERKEHDTWSVGITRREREQCRWLKPVIQVEVEFIDRTRIGFLRQCRFKSFV